MFIGHKKQWQLLKTSVKTGKIAHAYLFLGESQIGKRTVAIEFIKLLNCQNNKKPCQTCRSCQDIEKGRHPDLITIEPQGQIKISQIRDLQWQLALHPYSAPFKTAIIDEAHLLNLEAASAFLKTLEEPKGKTVVILITPYAEMMLATILSRVQTIKFYPVSFLEIERYLKEKGSSSAHRLSSLSLGRPGRAIDYLNDPQKLENREQKVQDLVKITQSNLAYRFQYANDLNKDPQNFKETLDIWLNYLRTILLLKIGIKKDNDLPMIDYSLPKLSKILSSIEETIHWLSSTNINSKLALETLMLKL